MSSSKLISLLALLSAGQAIAQTFTYLDATTGPGGNTTFADGSVFSPPVNGTTGSDNNWEERTGFANGGNVIEAAGEYISVNGENAPEIRTLITGLAPGGTYQVYVHFWDGGSTNAWSIRAGFVSNPGANTQFVAVGDLVAFPNATEGGRSGSLNYDTAPSLYVEADRTAYAASVGTTVADGSGQIVVYIDDLPNITGDPAMRTWYDGVSHALIAPPPAPPIPNPPIAELVPEPESVARPGPIAPDAPAPEPVASAPEVQDEARQDGDASRAPAFRRRLRR